LSSNDAQNPLVVVPVTLEVAESYTLTVLVDPAAGGTVEIDPFQDSYLHGQDVRLTAVAATGWLFESWSSDAHGMPNGTDPVTVVTIEGSVTVTATFREGAPYRIMLPLVRQN
jgi:hypothetical protein